MTSVAINQAGDRNGANGTRVTSRQPVAVGDVTVFEIEPADLRQRRSPEETGIDDAISDEDRSRLGQRLVGFGVKDGQKAIVRLQQRRAARRISVGILGKRPAYRRKGARLVGVVGIQEADDVTSGGGEALIEAIVDAAVGVPDQDDVRPLAQQLQRPIGGPAIDHDDFDARIMLSLNAGKRLEQHWPAVQGRQDDGKFGRHPSFISQASWLQRRGAIRPKHLAGLARSPEMRFPVAIANRTALTSAPAPSKPPFMRQTLIPIAIVIALCGAIEGVARLYEKLNPRSEIELEMFLQPYTM